MPHHSLGEALSAKCLYMSIINTLYDSFALKIDSVAHLTINIYMKLHAFYPLWKASDKM